MTIKSISDFLARHPFFADLDAGSIADLADCAVNVHVRPGEYLFREGDAAEHFYVIARGRIALELFSPATGPHVLESAGEGEVLDWPWLVPPYRSFFDARAVAETDVVSLDARCLRGKCDADPKLGYHVVLRVAEVMSHRLQATRVRLLDLYRSA